MSQKKRSLFLTHDGLTDPLGQSQIIPYLAGVSKEYQVHIISCEKPEKYERLRGDIETLLKQYDIVWHPVPYRNSPPIISTLFMLRQMYLIAKKLCNELNPVLVHCRSYLSALVGMRLKKKFGLKMIFDIRGFWADERVEGGVWNLKNPIYAGMYSYMKKNEQLFFASADATVCLTRASAEVVIKTFDVPPNKVTVIPCAADLNLFNVKNKVPKAVIAEKLGIPPSAKVLTYLGSVGTGYMLEEMLDFYKIGGELVSDLYFLFVSPKESHSYIMEAAQMRGIDKRKIVMRFSSRKELPEILSAVDYSVFFYKPTFSRKATSPTKHGELTALHIPCVTNQGVGDMELIIGEKNIGVLINAFTNSQYKLAWQHLIQLQIQPETFDYTANKYYSLENGIQSYKMVYQTQE